MHRWVLTFALVLLGLLVVAREDGARAAEIAKLVGGLGHEDFAVRNAAEERLTKLSWRAFPAVEEILRNDDPEIAQRARRIHGRLTNATLEQQSLIRQKAEAAFDGGRYTDAAELYGLLAFQDGLVVHSRLWLGHAYHLAGQWQDAVDAYRLALERTEFVEEHAEIPAGRFVILDRAIDTGKAQAVVRGGRQPNERDERMEALFDRAPGGIPWGCSVVLDGVTPAGQGYAVVRGRQVRVPSGTGKRPLRSLMIQANQLRLLIGLLEREEIGDLEAASRTFAGATDSRGILKRTTPELAADYADYIRKNMVRRDVLCDDPARQEATYSCWCLKELAVTQERMGNPVTALDTWDRVRLIRLRYDVSGGTFCVVREMGRLVQALDAPMALPGKKDTLSKLRDISGVFLMSSGQDSYHFDLADPKVLARTSYTSEMESWEFALVATPGQEIAGLDVSCDIEQHELRYGGQFSCWVNPGGGARIELGHIGWPRGRAAGRGVITKHFDVPAGARLVHIRNGSWKGRFTVHGITVKATFRRRSADGTAPTGGVEIRSQALPPGGILVHAGDKAPDEGERTDFPAGGHRGCGVVRDLPAGEHLFSYNMPGRTDRKQIRATLAPGGRYQLFINLDSPFNSTLTNLGHFPKSSLAHKSMARLRDGRWLVAYATIRGREYGRQPRIMLSTSRDLVTWEKPWEFRHDSVFGNTAPSLLVDHEGTIWLAWFSNRLELDRLEGMPRLWLASSRDGREWTRPMPVGCACKPQQTRTRLARPRMASTGSLSATGEHRLIPLVTSENCPPFSPRRTPALGTELPLSVGIPRTGCIWSTSLGATRT